MRVCSRPFPSTMVKTSGKTTSSWLHVVLLVDMCSRWLSTTRWCGVELWQMRGLLNRGFVQHFL